MIVPFKQQRIFSGLFFAIILFSGSSVSISYAVFNGSPLQQIQDGIFPENVICNEGRILVFKTHTLLSICIFINSFVTLEQRNYIQSDFGVLLDQTIEATYGNSANSESVYLIKYLIDNGKITSIIKELDKEYLDVLINPTDDGILYVELPRVFLDTLIPLTNIDDPFLVLLDGNEIQFQEIHTTPSSRILKINFNTDSQLIEIFGAR